MPLGKSINLYLMDGTEEGRWQATIIGWTGIGYKIPRRALKECADLSYINTPGVYFLFGKDDATGRQFIYVGEAEDVQKRLLQPHTFEKDGLYWTEAVVFLAQDDSLEKGRVKYLEHRFYTIATEAKRYLVKNGNTPTKSSLPKPIRDFLESFLLNVKLILPALGYRALIPMPSSDVKNTKDGDQDLLYLKRSKPVPWEAVGKVTAEGFWVLKGSYIHPNVASYAPANVKKAREQYADKVDKNHVLKEDICFGSPSFASSFVCGKNTSGLKEWKNEKGISLGDVDTSASAESDSTEKLVKGKTKAYSTKNGKSDRAIFHIAGNKVQANGRSDEKGFLVFKGSQYSLTETKSCPPYIKKMRAKLIGDGKLSKGIFLEDVLFRSSSGAAACVMGGTANGKVVWLYPDGKSIKEVEKSKED